MSVSINGTNGLTFSDGTSQNTGATGFGFKNRIINGAMMIDQRNAGASVTLSSTTQYPTDRFGANKDTSSATCTSQRSSTAPSNYINSLLWTTSTGASPASGDDNVLKQFIEGLNVADLGWGTSTAQSVTLSFWVRSSQTGTFGVSFANSAADRCYVASYIINSANTWEQKTITIAGDTSGTWLTTNGIGIRLYWDMGSGSSRSISASSSWGSTFATGLTGGVKIVGTTGATFYITGVQLEKGSTATSFDYRPYGTELALCQRYYEKISNTSNNAFCSGMATQSTVFRAFLGFQVEKRTAPSVSYSSTSTFLLQGNNTNYAVTATGTVAFGTKGVYTQFGATGMTQGYAYTLIDGSGSYADFSAEL